MAAKRKAGKKQQRKAVKRPACKPRQQKKPARPLIEAVSVPALQSEHTDEGQAKASDSFFDEEVLKEFSVRDDEEDGDESDVGDAGGEPAWDEDEF